MKSKNTKSAPKLLEPFYTQHQSLHIPVGTWHQLANEHDTPLKLVEIQYGKNCVEEDIERK
jgi:mannose-6-phosphate isomerase-like protein (cupin superfamily)